MVRIDNVFSFGATSAPGVFGRLADLFILLVKFMSVEDALKWVDDFVFFRYPAGAAHGRFVYKYDEEIFFDLADDLGWPWELDKHSPFSHQFTYIVFDWDAEEKKVALPEAKRLKYLAKIATWVVGAKVSRKEVDNVVGTLTHCTYVVPPGRSRLVNMYRLSASFHKARNAFIKFSVSEKVAKDIAWWRDELEKPRVELQIVQPPPPEADEIYVDVFTSWGIGFVFRGKWLTWEYKEGWFLEGRCIGWGEMVAIELALRALIASGVTNAHFILRSDNQGVIGALAAGRSYNAQENVILQQILRLYHEYSIWFTIVWVPSKENTADAPSRAIFPPRSRLYPYPPKVPRHLKEFIFHSVAHKDL